MGGKYPGADAIRAVCDAKAAGAEVTGVARTKVRSVLALMKQLATHEPDVLERAYAAKQEADRAKLERMSLYAQSGTCRWSALLEYFGEGDGFERCGSCDNCVTPIEDRLRTPA
jgi:superfamily II DNA helicase RecQ